jgi:hypothetical protein
MEEERLLLGSEIVEWSLRIVEELLKSGMNHFFMLPLIFTRIFGIIDASLPLIPSDLLPSLFSQPLCLLEETSPSPLSKSYLSSKGDLMISNDLEILSKSSNLFESLTIDSEIARCSWVGDQNQSLSPAHSYPHSRKDSTEIEVDDLTSRIKLHPDTSFLFHVLKFIESGAPPSNWSWQSLPSTPEDIEDREKVFTESKTSISRALVIAPSEDKVREVVMKEEEETTDREGRKGWLVRKLGKWLKGGDEGREDLVTTASLVLGNLARGGE